MELDLGYYGVIRQEKNKELTKSHLSGKDFSGQNIEILTNNRFNQNSLVKKVKTLITQFIDDINENRKMHDILRGNAENTLFGDFGTDNFMVLPGDDFLITNEDIKNLHIYVEKNKNYFLSIKEQLEKKFTKKTTEELLNIFCRFVLDDYFSRVDCVRLKYTSYTGSSYLETRLSLEQSMLNCMLGYIKVTLQECDELDYYLAKIVYSTQENGYRKIERDYYSILNKIIYAYAETSSIDTFKYLPLSDSLMLLPVGQDFFISQGGDLSSLTNGCGEFVIYGDNYNSNNNFTGRENLYTCILSLLKREKGSEKIKSTKGDSNKLDQLFQKKNKSLNMGYMDLKLCFCFQATVKDYLLYALADQFAIHCDAVYLSGEIRIPLIYPRIVDHAKIYFSAIPLIEGDYLRENKIIPIFN